MQNLTPFGSLVLRDQVSTAAMRDLWTDRAMIEAWMAVERAIVEAQAELGMIPAAAAGTICEKLTPEVLTVERIVAEQASVRHVMVAFLKAFREICGPAAEHFHVGPTTQDILDSGLALQMKQAHGLILAQLADLQDRLCERALQYKDTVVMGRSHQQHAVPTTFGFVLAVWAKEMSDHIARARESEKRWMLGNLSGSVGAQNSFVELSDIPTARRLQRRVCEKLGLGVPCIDLHTRSDRFAEVTTNLASLCNSLSQIGLNIATWQRPEVLEVEEPYDDGFYSSSTMPNKVNPEPSEGVIGLAKLVRGLATAMQDVQVFDNRDGSRRPVEITALPSAYMMTAKALETTTRNIGGLVVHGDTMLANLAHPRALGQAAGERLMITMYKKTGQRDRAHALLHRCALRSRRENRPLKDVILEDAELSAVFAPDELDALCDLTSYVGTAALQTEETVDLLRQGRQR